MTSTTARVTLLTALAAAAALPSAATAAGAAPGTLIQCQSIAVRDTHGGVVKANTHLSPIRNGRVQTVNPHTNVVARVPFHKTSGRWLTARDGRRYAVANQYISPSGRRGGMLLVTAPAPSGGKVPCSGRRPFASAADTASYASDGTLPGSGYTEVAASTTNVTARLLDNVATKPILTGMAQHPDGAPRCADNPNPAPGVYCYTGKGAGLNDMYGVERYSPTLGGMYIDDPYHRHFIVYSGATVAAAKRPSTRPDGTVIVGSAIAWRPVAKNATIAN